MNQLNMFDMYTPVHVTKWTTDDLKLARQKRDTGIKQVSANNREFLIKMRAAAKQICREKGWVCADDLRAYSDSIRCWPSHQNAWGAVLTLKEFVPGEYIVSKQPQGRANRIRRWTLRATA